MSSFHFSDEDKPEAALPQPEPSPPTAATPPANAPAPAEEEDDFSFLSQTPAQTPAQPAPAQPVAPPVAGQPVANARPTAPRPQQRTQPGAAQAQVPGVARPVPPARPTQPAQPTRSAQPAQSQPLHAGTGASGAPRPNAAGKATFTPGAVAPSVVAPSAVAADALHPVGVPNPSAAPNPAAAAALTPTPTTPAAEEVFSEEAKEDINAGFFGLGTSIRSALNMLEGPASWALRVFGIVGILCLAFLLAALFFGGVGTLGATNPKTAVVLRNIEYAAKGFSVCLLATTIATLILGYEDNRMGAIFAFIGAALMFGSPLLVKAAAGETLAGALVGPHVIPELRSVGRVLFYLGALKATIDLFDFLWKLPDRMRAKMANVGQGRPTEAKQRAIASQANMMSPCWKLPFCREAIRVLCPAFIAKTTCWKFGRGCYCDEEMIGRIVRGEPMAVISAPTRISQSKPPCGRCYIYLEHQTYKFRMLSPLALPATIGLCFVGYPIYTKLFQLFDKAMQSVWGMFSFSPPVPKIIDTVQANKDAIEQSVANAAQVSSIAEAIMGVMVGFFLLIYITKGIEWAIFKAKL